MNDLTGKSQQKPYIVEIASDRDGQRIDNYLVSQLKGVPKSHIYRILRKGEVRVNKGRVKADYRLKTGDLVRIPPIRQSEKPKARPGDSVLQLIERSILFEDKKLLVINKPPGVAVHGGSGISYGVIEALRALRPDFPYFELVHRLDRDTSGCLIIAKKRSALRQLHELFRSDQMEKHYLALVRGPWKGGKRTVDAPLLKNTLKSGERMVAVHSEGKSALSVFEPVEHYKTEHDSPCLVRVILKTGRTHQIRVHAAHIDHPIAGDQKYGDTSFNQRMRAYGLNRLFLHASYVGFELPEGGEIAVTAPLSDELQYVLHNLK
jgi:23S rRNA pseudouridine955/2504/2580 synthase